MAPVVGVTTLCRRAGAASLPGTGTPVMGWRALIVKRGLLLFLATRLWSNLRYRPRRGSSWIATRARLKTCGLR